MERTVSICTASENRHYWRVAISFH